MIKHKIKFVVRITNGGETAGYVRDLELPFVPTVGMRFEQGVSTPMWETSTSERKYLTPCVEEVIYDFNEESLVCLFTIDSTLASSFWTPLMKSRTHSQGELDYFRH